MQIPSINYSVFNTENRNIYNSSVFDTFTPKKQKIRAAYSTLAVDRIELAQKKPIKVFASIAFAGIATIGVGAAIFFGKTKAIKILQKEMAEFPQDVLYRKNILKGLNLPEENYHLLRPIIGSQEFTKLVKEMETTPEVYSPGKKAFKKNNEAFFPQKENVKNFVYGANLHLHTKYSDGKFEIPELLEQAVQYADKRVALGKKPFIFAITDHDCTKGCEEAINLILENPQKYKNIRLVLGIENSTIVNNKNLISKPSHIHVLSYGINPYDKNMHKHIYSKVKLNKENIEKALSNANSIKKVLPKEYDFSYSMEELFKMVPSLNYSNKSASFFTKDYLQFKLIYTSMIEKNPQLQNYMKTHSIKTNFIEPINLIPKKPDYSNGKRYYHHYYDSLQKHITNLAKTKDKNFGISTLKNFFNEIPREIKNILEEFEINTCNPKALTYVPPVGLDDFFKSTKKLNSMEGINIGIAHPGVVFPHLEQDELPKLHAHLYEYLNKISNGKTIFSEDFYQVYYADNSPKIMEQLNSISQKHGFTKTGGLDTHTNDIFSSK